MTTRKLYQMFYRHARRNFREWQKFSTLYAAMKCRDIAKQCELLAVVDPVQSRDYRIKAAAYKSVLLAREAEIARLDMCGYVLTKKAMEYIRMENVQ